MISEPLVSIIVPCYNVEKYVEQCINSVISQDYKNWECILINDGSKDKTLDLVLTYEKLDSRFKVLTQENVGLSATRNRGIYNAKGDFIFFLDSDDILSQDAIRVLVSAADNCDIITGVIVTANIKNEDIVKISQLQHPKEGNIVFKNEHFEVLTRTMESGLAPVAQNRVYRKGFIKENDLKFKVGILHEDELWFFETMLKARNVKFISDETYFYRTDNEDSITKKLSDRNLESYIEILNEVYTKYIVAGKSEFAKWYIVYFKKLFIDFAIRERTKLSNEIIKSLEKTLQITFTELSVSNFLSQPNVKYYKGINKLSTKPFDVIEKYFFRNPVNSIRKKYKLILINYFIK